MKLLNSNYCKFLYSALALLFCGSGFASTSAEHFVREMNEHRARLPGWQLLLKREFSLIFANISEYQIIQASSLHDLTKVMTLSELRELGYLGEKTLAERFAVFHGKNRWDLLPEDQSILSELIAEHNLLEELLHERFFADHSFSNEARAEYFQLERISDTTDTGIFRLHEINPEVLLDHNGSRYLRSRGDHLNAFLSHWLEEEILFQTGRTVITGPLPHIVRSAIKCSKVAAQVGHTLLGGPLPISNLSLFPY